MRMPDRILSGTLALASLVLALTLAGPAGAVDTLSVKVTERGPWTTYSFGKALSDATFPQGTRKPCVSRDGSIWWGFYGGVEKGALRYDGKVWLRYTARDGLMDGDVRSIAQSADGTLYFSGSHRGKAAVTCFDGKTWRIYTETDGLFGSFVGGASAVDTHGNLWVSTESPPVTDWALIWADRTKGGSGVFRFDGKTWRNYRVEDGLVHNRVYDIAAGPDGSVWFATLRGVSRFDGKAHSTDSEPALTGTKGQAWTTSTPLVDLKSYDILVTRNGKVWCAHGEASGISVFDGTAWKRISEADGMPEGRVLRICQARDGAIWFGTHQNHLKLYGTKGLLRYQDGAWLRILKEDGLPGDNVHSIAQARDGSLYLTVPDVGIVRYQPDFSVMGTISGTVKKPDGSPWVGVGMCVEDRAGQVRAGAATDAEGRYRVRMFPGAYRVSVIRGQGAEPVEVAVAERKERQMVDFTPTGVRQGIVVPAGPGKTVKAGPGKTVKAGNGFRQRLWQSFGPPDGLTSYTAVISLLQDKEGNLWFGTFGGGVTRYDGTHFATFTAEDGLVNNMVWSILQDRKGNLWFGVADRWDNPEGGGGVSRYDGTHFTNFTTKDGLVNNWVLSVMEDHEGNLWFGTRGGVSRYDGTHFTNFTVADGLARGYVWSLLEDKKGNMWFGTREGGVSRYDGKAFTTFTTKDGLGSNNINQSLQDQKGYLWFGTWRGGVSRYDGKAFTTFTTKDGLAHNDVFSIFQDREGHLWFGTEGGGVSRYDGTRFTNFTTDDGLADSVVWSILEDREGHLWFGMEGGDVSRYDGQRFVTFTTKDGLGSNN